MSMDAASPTPPAEVPASAAPVPRKTASPMEVLKAITEPMRHAVLRELADISYPSVLVLAKKLGCSADMMGRHLQRMKKAGIVIRVNPAEEADQRAKYYQVPKEFRSTLPDGRHVLDFGSCLLRFDPA